MSTRPSFSPDRQGLNRLMMLLDECRKVYPDITIQQVMTLLWVAGEPELTQGEIAQRSGVTKAAISRHVEVLGPPRSVRGKPMGYGLLDIETDPMDRRRQFLVLSPTGQRVVTSLIHLMNK